MKILPAPLHLRCQFIQSHRSFGWRFGSGGYLGCFLGEHSLVLGFAQVGRHRLDEFQDFLGGQSECRLFVGGGGLLLAHGFIYFPRQRPQPSSSRLVVVGPTSSSSEVPAKNPANVAVCSPTLTSIMNSASPF